MFWAWSGGEEDVVQEQPMNRANGSRPIIAIIGTRHMVDPYRVRVLFEHVVEFNDVVAVQRPSGNRGVELEVMLWADAHQHPVKGNALDLVRRSQCFRVIVMPCQHMDPRLNATVVDLVAMNAPVTVMETRCIEPDPAAVVHLLDHARTEIEDPEA